MLAMILKFSSFGAEQIDYFSRLGFCSCMCVGGGRGGGVEISHINAHRRRLNVLYIYKP